MALAVLAAAILGFQLKITLIIAKPIPACLGLKGFAGDLVLCMFTVEKSGITQNVFFSLVYNGTSEAVRARAPHKDNVSESAICYCTLYRMAFLCFQRDQAPRMMTEGAQDREIQIDTREFNMNIRDAKQIRDHSKALEMNLFIIKADWVKIFWSKSFILFGEDEDDDVVEAIGGEAWEELNHLQMGIIHECL
ncbi:hypothetical protein ACJX0J_007524, partial [Zea mays]